MSALSPMWNMSSSVRLSDHLMATMKLYETLNTRAVGFMCCNIAGHT